MHRVQKFNGKLTKVEEDVLDKFHKLPDEDRIDFYEKKHGTLLKHLPAEIQTTIDSLHAKKESDKFGMKGKFIDSPDLQDKYAKKPEQLENIKMNARQFVCPIRGAVSYTHLTLPTKRIV